MIGGIKLEEGDFRRNIAVVGLGLIGGSFAMALRKHNAVRIFGIDIDESVLNKAAGCGVIDEGASNAKKNIMQIRYGNNCFVSAGSN